MRRCRWDGEWWHKATLRWILEENIRAAELEIPEAQKEMGIRRMLMATTTQFGMIRYFMCRALKKQTPVPIMSTVMSSPSIR